jgi:hypothetical protein
LQQNQSEILIIITPTTTAKTSLLVDVKKSHVNSSPSLSHQMQQHRDTEDDDLRNECSPPLKGKRKEKKTPPYALGIKNLPRTKAESKLRRKQNSQREGFAKSGSSAWDCLLWSHNILATTQQQVGPTC